MTTIFSSVNFGDIKGNTPILEPITLSVKVNEINDIDKNFAKFKNSSGIALGLNAKVYAKAGVGIADDDDHYWIKDRYTEQSESNDYVHILSSVGEHTFTAPYGVSEVSVLLVGGGAGGINGGNVGRGGGGAGAVVNSTINTIGGKNYIIAIGNGGNAQTNGYATFIENEISANGGFIGYVRVGGECGDNIHTGGAGGANSGGGGAGSGGNGNSGSGFNGGAGGIGVSCDIIGYISWYGGGGGGSGMNGSGGNGGNGGGGRGGSTNAVGSNGVVATGGGGGAGGGGTRPAAAGKGGSGIVVIRYTVPNLEYVGTSIGEGAIVGQDAPGSIQIGSGTNNVKDTVQIKEYPFLSSDGKIYEERFPNELLNSNLSSTVYSAISSNIQHILGDPMIFKGVFSPTEDYKRGNVVLTDFFEYVCSVDFQSHGAWNDVISGFVYLGDEGSYVKKGEIMDADIASNANIQLSKIEGGEQLASTVASLNTDVQNLNTNSVKKYELGNFASCDYQIMSQAEYDALETKQSNKLYIISADI